MNIRASVLLAGLLLRTCAGSLVATGDHLVGSCSEDDHLEANQDCAGYHPVHVAVQLKDGDDDALARLVAEEAGMRYRQKVGDLPGLYMFDYDNEVHKSRRHKREAHQQLSSHPRVLEATEQHAKRRVKRDYLPGRSQRNVNNKFPFLPWPDPLYPHQWYLHSGAVGGYDMRVVGAWRLGYSGKHVSVSILDDGIQLDHADLAANYDPMASKDINDNDNDPTPQDNGDNKHGTRCAGEVAAIAGNDRCGVGVAYNASIGGVRMLDGPVSDAVEAASLSLNQQHIDIYSASWGPEDDGRTFDGPGPLARRAFHEGITTGRGGKGNIFVWASGNGGSHQDSCSCDGYTTSIYTLSISSATFDNHQPWYLEECPSTIATTYSSANMGQPAIVTVDVPHGCTEQHTGTSASAPLAAGIIALALEANPALTWRDMQHLVLRTADPTALLSNPGWEQNGVGRKVSTKFGYGLMDAERLVKEATSWQPLPAQNKCEQRAKMGSDGPVRLSGKFHLQFTLELDDCDGRVKYLEHLHAKVTLKFSRRGEIKLTLVSPMGTRSVILPPRPRDINNSGFHEWPFLSVQQWGEHPAGTWTLIIENDGSPMNSGTFHGWSLVLYGTAEPAQPTDRSYGQQPAAALTDSSVSDANRSGSSGSSSSSHHQQAATPAAQPQPNVGNCHAECTADGCHTARSASACFACTHYEQALPNKHATKCVHSCTSAGYYTDEQGRRCAQCLKECAACTDKNSCTSCAHSGHKLVMADTAHVLHGRCVEECPAPLIVQGEYCVPPNQCPTKQYTDATGNCVACDVSCATCFGTSSAHCTDCAPNYGNYSGVCLRCCARSETAAANQCAHCARSVWPATSGVSQMTVVLLILAVVVTVFAIVFACLMLRDKRGSRYPYTKLPVRYNLSGRRGKGADEDGMVSPNGLIMPKKFDLISDSEMDETDDDDGVRDPNSDPEDEIFSSRVHGRTP